VKERRIKQRDAAGILGICTSGLSQKFLPLGPRQSPGIEIVGEGGSIEAIQPPSPTTQSRELSRRSKWQEFLGKTTSPIKAVPSQRSAKRRKHAEMDALSWTLEGLASEPCQLYHGFLLLSMGESEKAIQELKNAIPPLFLNKYCS